jgi:hypothetical protein
MPYAETDLVDFAATKNLEKLEAAFSDLMALRTASYVDDIQDRVGAGFSATGEDE